MSQILDPAIEPGYAAPFGLGHRHMQSMLAGWGLRGRLIRRRARDFVKASAARIIDCGDGIRLLGLSNEQQAVSRGLVVVLHGWEGCADSNYMIALGDSLFAAGYDVFRLNFRDHGGTQALNEGLFHSCRLDEVVNAVGALKASRSGRPISLVGFSLGGNFALRVAASAPRSGIDIRRIVAVCPVLRPHATMRALEEGFWVYRKYFLGRWRRSLRAKAAMFPELYDFGDLRRFATLTETTDFFVRNYTGYRDLDAYLEGYAITGDRLRELEIDSILISTRDDPVIPVADLADVARSSALSVRILDRGGHCGMLDSYRLRSWLDTAIVELLEA